MCLLACDKLYYYCDFSPDRISCLIRFQQFSPQVCRFPTKEIINNSFAQWYTIQTVPTTLQTVFICCLEFFFPCTVQFNLLYIFPIIALNIFHSPYSYTRYLTQSLKAQLVPLPWTWILPMKECKTPVFSRRSSWDQWLLFILIAKVATDTSTCCTEDLNKMWFYSFFNKEALGIKFEKCTCIHTHISTRYVDLKNAKFGFSCHCLWTETESKPELLLKGMKTVSISNAI